MAHTHAGNLGDVLKHVVLFDALRLVARSFPRVRHFDFYSGEGIYANVKPASLPPESKHGQTFEAVQVKSPNWYAGSPIVAMAALKGLNAELKFSDEDEAAIRRLREALKSRTLNNESWPNDWMFDGPVDVGVAKFDPNKLGGGLLRREEGVNTILLDPTYSDGYSAAAVDAAVVLRESGANAVLICWQVNKWGISSALRHSGFDVLEAIHGVYSMSLVAIGPVDGAVTSSLAEVVSGW